MEVHQHTNSSERIDNVPSSTPEEIDHGRAIVFEELGDNFWLTIGLPRHVGSKGDDRVYGETVMIESDNPELAQQVYANSDRLADISTRITNELPAVVKVLFDPLGLGNREDSDQK